MKVVENSVLGEKPSGAPVPEFYTSATKRRTLAQAASFHLKTLYLFTRSDVKTVLAPQIIFILAAVFSREPLTTAFDRINCPIFQRLPLAILWIWLNLIVCGISNQRLADSIVEDEHNKPWRPLAAKRLTPPQAQRLLLGMIPLVVAVSAVLGGFKPTISMMTLLWMYNDLDGSSINIWARNAINTGGIMCFSAGALEVLSGGDLLPKAWAWIGVTGAVIATTVQALDFPDMEGDKARGRKTIPLLYGEGVARGGLAVLVLLWSTACPLFWNLPPAVWAAPLGVGVLMAGLTVVRQDEKSDDVVAKLWCLWLAVLYLLPLFAA
ncbi:UbiA prenyltransferase [Colletotrichum godetiae]|uniref:UbiA prenyltransferase n=1 Tax=Colletotrichum godetiae TaxID=1209918 RepID=A0AAJ0EXH2_9PEZI|nr:UbiA prenyltransferase [Colletotrichum godetiae]KAK1691044.1 UbiA prenyltransferase [Colletotrichum godetiae]